MNAVALMLYLKNNITNRSIMMPTPTIEVARMMYIQMPPSLMALAIESISHLPSSYLVNGRLADDSC